MAGKRKDRGKRSLPQPPLLALVLATSILGGDAFAVFPSITAGTRSRAGALQAARAASRGGWTRSSERGRRRTGSGSWAGSEAGILAAEARAEAETMSGTTAAATAPVAPAESPRAEDSPSSASASDQDSEGEVPSESETTRSSGAVKGRNPSAPRELGDLADDGFSGTRPGFQVLKEYTVPDEAPTNLPEGEEKGYPMLIYQFMHAQYRDEFPSQSSSRKAVRRKELLLNGFEVRNDSKVKPGDVITMQKRVQPGLFPQGKASCELPVVWEDDFLAVVIKPAGVAVHGGTGEGDPGPGGRRSVRQALPYMLKPTKSQDRPLHRPLHCHRLDKPTGGLLICAKTRPALSGLSDAFEERLVSKRYVAIVAGELEGSGAIVTPLDGKACQTNYRVRGPPVQSLKSGVITTVDLWPITGRFHQLRRHLASIGCPILGDRRYTPNEVPFQEGGLYLQAVGLTFPHPITGEKLNFSIPEPAKFEKWRTKEQERWLQHHEDASGGSSSGLDGSDQGTGGREGEKPSVNALPDVEGLQTVERDGFRYYQYDWSVVGGKPTALSTEDIDAALDGAP